MKIISTVKSQLSEDVQTLPDDGPTLHVCSVKTFVERLDFAIECSGLSQNEVEEAAGMSTGALSHLRKAKNPSIAAAGKLAPVLNVAPEWLAYATGDPPVPRAAAGKGRPARRAPELVIVPDDRYPNRAEALALLGDIVEPETARAMRGRKLSSEADPSVDAWIAAALEAQKKRDEAKAKRAAGEAAPAPPEGDAAVRSYVAEALAKADDEARRPSPKPPAVKAKEPGPRELKLVAPAGKKGRR